MKKHLLFILASLSLNSMIVAQGVPPKPTGPVNQATPRATTPPPNCATASGYPCTRSSWTAVSCTAGPPTFGGTNGTQDSGPCIAGVLRCTGSTNVCTQASLPAQTGSVPQPLIGNTLWKVLVSTFPQTTSTSDYFYDNQGLSYSTVYTYVSTVQYTGSGGGIWSAYSNSFQVPLPQAPVAGPGTPATPSGLSVNPF